MATKTQCKIHCTMSDGREFDVVADQRDWAAAEAKELTTGTLTHLRFLAYSAAHRDGRYNGAWHRWNDVDLEEADSSITEPADAGAGDGGDQGDSEDGGEPDPTPAATPGPTVTSAASESRSPGRRANRSTS